MSADEVDIKISFSNQSLKSNLKKFISIPADGKYYDTTNDKRGIALVFNHGKFRKQSEREGTEKDKNNIAQTLNDLKFDVRVYDDLTVYALRTVLEKVAGEDHRKNDCLLVVVMSHGEQGTIYAYDEQYEIEELWENFAGYNCPSLIGKPKIFLIQACRGSKIDEGATYSEEANDEMDGITEINRPTEFVIPRLADLLIVFSTFEGYYSFRNPDTGSWFIQSICKELAENSNTDSLQELILGITRRVAYEYQSNIPRTTMDQKKQIPTTLSTMTKTFYFTKNKSTCVPITYPSLSF